MNKSLVLVLKSEGGFAIEAEDVGGSSFAGITQKSYKDEYLPIHGHKFPDAPQTVKELGGTSVDNDEFKYSSPLDIPEEYGVRTDIIIDFYENFYLPKSHANLLPECLQYIHSDFFVNARSKAIKIIQEWVGCEEIDGEPGPETRAKMSSWTIEQNDLMENDPYHDNELITKYDEAKREHYNYLATKNPDKFGENLRGWLIRCDHVKAELHDYFVDESPTPSAVEEEDDVVLVEETGTTTDTVDTPSILAAINNLTDKIDNINARVTQIENSRIGKKKW